ncbi:hypothetical protein [Dyella kyungheensis]|uniref:Uncharacterized protein n=1 Tax=Dyella kyungheensis TaxID=1242174 RepID=A0ABS2JYK7_9GAMM|nr:hypothetical protein [Dyella kyungheensis]MBM7123724.1 hypothetical protein [Dyella kyungheensis]
MVARVLVVALACLSLFFLAVSPQQRLPERVLQVTVCELVKDPARYDHALVQVSGDLLHGFEAFQIYPDHCPEAPDSMGVWLEYGGTSQSGTMYCCGVIADGERSEPLVVEGVRTYLKVDAAFQRFDAQIGGKDLTRVNATLIGRFFSGRQLRYPKGKGVFWGGYGHMGAYSLLVIQQVLSSVAKFPAIPEPPPPPNQGS